MIFGHRILPKLFWSNKPGYSVALSMVLIGVIMASWLGMMIWSTGRSAENRYINFMDECLLSQKLYECTRIWFASEHNVLSIKVPRQIRR
jgi:hypothetical protein